MAAYLIAEIDVHDTDVYEQYKALTPAAVAVYGGKFIVRGGAVQPKEGDWHPKRMVVIEFADLATAQRFYDSPEYAKPLAMRKRSANTRLILIEGAA